MNKLHYLCLFCFIAAAIVSCQDDDDPGIGNSPPMNSVNPPSNSIHFSNNGGTDTVRNYAGPMLRLIEYQGVMASTFYDVLKKYNEEKLTMPGKGYPISDTIVGDWFTLIKLDPKVGGYYKIEVQPNLSDSTRLLVLWKDNYEKVAWWFQSDMFHGWDCEPYFFIDQQDVNGNPYLPSEILK